MRAGDIVKNVRTLEIRTRRVVDHITAGAYHSVFKGRGMEFEEVRQYIPGDDVRSIDWNVTARLGEPYIKKFVEERQLTIFLLVDISASGDFGSGVKSKKEMAAEISALLAFSAERNNDRVGLILFTGGTELYVPPRKGRTHTLRLIRELLACERKGKTTNIRRALETVIKLNRRHAVVFLISDMLDTGYERTLRLANKRHDVIALRITDPVELQCPRAGFINTLDAEEDGKTVSFNSNSRENLRKFTVESASLRNHAEQACKQAAVDLVDLTCGHEIVKPLMRFFHLREQRRKRS